MRVLLVDGRRNAESTPERRARGVAAPESWSLSALFVQMEAVQEAVDDRGEDDAGGGDGGKPRIEREDSGERLARAGLEMGVHRSHAGQDHRRVEECVDPRLPDDEAVA